MTHMAMVKTQVYLSMEDLAELHRLSRKAKRPVAEMVREAVRIVWLKPSASGPVALWDGPFHGTSLEHDAAFDEP